MEIIPMIFLKNEKLINTKLSKAKHFNNVLEKTSESTLYILDNDGIEKNKPNLNLYQELSKSYILWVDAGPRNIGDVVDLVIAGS